MGLVAISTFFCFWRDFNPAPQLLAFLHKPVAKQRKNWVIVLGASSPESLVCGNGSNTVQ